MTLFFEGTKPTRYFFKKLNSYHPNLEIIIEKKNLMRFLDTEIIRHWFKIEIKVSKNICVFKNS